jgi:DUF1365 family protein
MEKDIDDWPDLRTILWKWSREWKTVVRFLSLDDRRSEEK